MNYKSATERFIKELMGYRLNLVKGIQLDIEAFEYISEGVRVWYTTQGSEDDYPLRECEVITNAELQVYIYLKNRLT